MSDDENPLIAERRAKLARLRAQGIAYPNDFRRDSHAEDQLQSWFITQMDSFLTSKKRRLVGWDEILEGGLAPNAVVMSWRGIDGGIAAAPGFALRHRQGRGRADRLGARERA